MTYKALLTQLKQKKVAPVYLLCGEEDYLLQMALHHLIEATVEPATREFNLDVFYGKEVDGGKVLDIANAYPMMAETRVVVVKQVFEMSVSDLEAIAKYLDRPAPSTVLVLTSDRMDARKKAVAQIKAKSCFVEFKPLYEREVRSWIREQVRERGFRISEDAALLIQSRVGNSLRQIVNELEKIILNLNGQKEITTEDVTRSVGLSRSFSIFDLTDAVGRKDAKQALTILGRILESGESPTTVLAMLTRFFINLVKLQEGAKQRLSDKELVALTGIPSFFLDKTRRMAANFSPSQLEQMFEKLQETDLILKTSQQPAKVALQSLLIQAVHL